METATLARLGEDGCVDVFLRANAKIDLKGKRREEMKHVVTRVVWGRAYPSWSERQGRCGGNAGGYACTEEDNGCTEDDDGCIELLQRNSQIT